MRLFKDFIVGFLTKSELSTAAGGMLLSIYVARIYGIESLIPSFRNFLVIFAGYMVLRLYYVIYGNGIFDPAKDKFYRRYRFFLILISLFMVGSVFVLTGLDILTSSLVSIAGAVFLAGYAFPRFSAREIIWLKTPWVISSWVGLIWLLPLLEINYQFFGDSKFSASEGIGDLIPVLASVTNSLPSNLLTVSALASVLLGNLLICETRDKDQVNERANLVSRFGLKLVLPIYLLILSLLAFMIWKNGSYLLAPFVITGAVYALVLRFGVTDLFRSEVFRIIIELLLGLPLLLGLIFSHLI